MSIGARAILLNSVLASLPSFHMAMFLMNKNLIAK